MNPIVILLIFINLVISLKGFNNRAFFERYKFNVNCIKKGQRYRLFSSAFLHVDYLHLIFNMYTLYLFSNIVLSHFNPLKYLSIYLFSLLSGNYLSLYLNKGKLDYSAVGASGAVTGVVYSSITLFPNMKLYILPLPFPISGYIFGIGYLFYSVYGMKNKIGNIGHSAHIGGAISGYFITLLLIPKLLYTSSMEVILMAIPILVLFFLEKKEKNSTF